MQQVCTFVSVDLFAADNVVWEQVVPFTHLFCSEASPQHVLGLCYQQRLLLQHEHANVVFYGLVTGADLCDDEVEEDDASDDDNAEPDEPEQAVLESVQLRRLIEREVADRDADDREDVRHKLVDPFVLYAWIGLGAESPSHLFGRIQRELAEVYYSKH